MTLELILLDASNRSGMNVQQPCIITSCTRHQAHKGTELLGVTDQRAVAATQLQLQSYHSLADDIALWVPVHNLHSSSGGMAQQTQKAQPSACAPQGSCQRSACMQRLLQFLHMLLQQLQHSLRVANSAITGTAGVPLTRLLRRVRSNSLSSRPRVLSLRSSCTMRKR
jgi:hypothetical protein